MNCLYCKRHFEPQKFVGNDAVELLCELDIPFKMIIPVSCPVNLIGYKSKVETFTVLAMKGSIEFWRDYFKDKIVFVFDCWYEDDGWYEDDDVLHIRFLKEEQLDD